MNGQRAIGAVGLIFWSFSLPLGCNGGCGGGGGGGSAGTAGAAGVAGVGGAGSGGVSGEGGGGTGGGQAGAGQAGAGQAGAGAAGTSGAGMGGAGAGTGGAGAAGTSGAAGSGGTPPPFPPVCGDNYRDPTTEECDDGPSHLATDACTDTCRVRDVLACASCGPISNTERFLGLGRHVTAAHFGPGAVVSFPLDTEAAHSAVGGDAPGFPSPVGGVQPGPFLSNPVVVPMPAFFVTVWTSQNGDGDGLGIQARTAHPEAFPHTKTINTSTLFGQRDADAVRISDTQFVTAWVDDTDLDTGPDLRVSITTVDVDKGFSGGGDALLANTIDAEGNVALCSFGTSYAAAWRAGMGALEEVRVKQGAVTWAIGPIPPGSADDRPGIAALDATHLALAYTKGIDTDLDGLPDKSELHVAVLDTAQPGAPVSDISLATTQAPYADQPSLAVAAGKIFVAYRIPGALGDPLGDELFLAELAFASGTLSVSTTWPLPHDPAHQVGDQRRPSLSSGPLLADAVLVAAWEDHGKTLSGALKRDVVLEVIPVPVVRMGFMQAGGN